MKNKQIYQNLSKLDAIWITKEYEKFEKEIIQDPSKQWLRYFPFEEEIIQDPSKQWLTYFPADNITKKIITFTKNNIYISELLKLWYIFRFNHPFDISTYYPILTDKWKIFLENYDSSKSKQLDTYLWKYPNISKLMYFIIWIIIWLIPFIIKIIL